MGCSITLWQFAKRAQITFGAVAKCNWSPFGSLCMRNLRIACNADHVSNTVYRWENLIQKKNKIEASLKFCLPSAVSILTKAYPIIPLSGKSNLVRRYLKDRCYKVYIAGFIDTYAVNLISFVSVLPVE
jgi:hypothetical protein